MRFESPSGSLRLGREGHTGGRFSYLLNFIPSGISGGGALIRLWLLP